jgi:hypothetical protein
MNAFSPDYRARTSDPADPCYIRGLTPVQAPRPEGGTYGVRVQRNCRAWNIWALLVRRGVPMPASLIAEQLRCSVKAINGTVNRLVKGQAIATRRVAGRFEYSVGTVPVVEM